MYYYGPRSAANLAMAHPYLQLIFNKVIEEFNCTVICSYRDEIEQTKAFNAGNTQVRFPDSKHNSNPSLAVDVAPYTPGIGIDWDNIELFRALGGYTLGIAAGLGIPLRWGGDWNGNWIFTDQNLIDLPHHELVGL